MPLTSAYVVTAVMNACPTRGLSNASRRSSARELASSRPSFSSSQRSTSREGKKHLFDVGAGASSLSPKLVERSFTDDAAIAQEHEAVSDAVGVVQLMDGEEQRTPAGRDASQQGADLAHLAQVETVEWLVEQQQWLRRQQCERQEDALPLSLGQRSDSLVQQ